MSFWIIRWVQQEQRTFLDIPQPTPYVSLSFWDSEKVPIFAPLDSAPLQWSEEEILLCPHTYKNCQKTLFNTYANIGLPSAYVV